MARRAGAVKRVLPEGSVSTIDNYVLGRNLDKWTAAEAFYDLLGYGMSHADSTNSSAAGIPRKPIDISNELKAFVARSKSDKGTAAGVEIAPPAWLNAFILRELDKLLVT
jgi:hypothetical protein